MCRALRSGRVDESAAAVVAVVVVVVVVVAAAAVGLRFQTVAVVDALAAHYDAAH